MRQRRGRDDLSWRHFGGPRASDHGKTATSSSKSMHRNATTGQRHVRRRTLRRCIAGAVLLGMVLFGCALLHYAWHRVREPLFETEHVLGAVTDRTARVWVYAQHHSHVLVRHRPWTSAQTEWQASDQHRVPSDADRHGALVVDLLGLIPNTSYAYQVIYFKSNTSEPTSASDVYRLRTYPTAGDATSFSFVYGSCIEMGFPWPLDTLAIFSTWKRLHDPLLSVLLGDSIYADLPFSIPFERAYRKLLEDEHYSRFFKEVSRYTTYDDHELSNNWDLGAGLPLFEEAMEAYDAFMGFANPDPPQGLPAHLAAFRERTRYYNFTVGNVGFFVLDERQYRSANSDEDGPLKTMLGSLQKEHLKRWLLDTNGTLTFRFIASPGMFASVGGPADGWCYFEHEREELFDFMERHNMGGILLLSGDVHWSAAFEHLPGLYEFATSPIHTFPLFPDVPRGRKGREIRTLFTHTWTFHYAVVEVDTAAEPPFVRHTTYAYLLDANRPQAIHSVTLSPRDVQRQAGT